jgi:hypothetical protein
MLRFTIRDLLWLMVVVGMGICLYQGSAQRRRLERQVRRANEELRKLDFKNGRLMETVANQRMNIERKEVATSPATLGRE